MLKDCPFCKADLRDYEHLNDKGEVQYYRIIGRVDFDKDRLTEWQCPDCSEIWPRGFGEIDDG